MSLEDKLKAVLEAHPELVAELEAAAEKILPPSIATVLHAVVPLIRGIDEVHAQELHAAIDAHVAEHQALMEAVKPAVPETGAEASSPAPDPASAPPAGPGPAPSMSYTGPGPDDTQESSS